MAKKKKKSQLDQFFRRSVFRYKLDTDDPKLKALFDKRLKEEFKKLNVGERRALMLLTAQDKDIGRLGGRNKRMAVLGAFKNSISDENVEYSRFWLSKQVFFFDLDSPVWIVGRYSESDRIVHFKHYTFKHIGRNHRQQLYAGPKVIVKGVGNVDLCINQHVIERLNSRLLTNSSLVVRFFNEPLVCVPFGHQGRDLYSIYGQMVYAPDIEFRVMAHWGYFALAPNENYMGRPRVKTFLIPDARYDDGSKNHEISGDTSFMNQIAEAQKGNQKVKIDALFWLKGDYIEDIADLRHIDFDKVKLLNPYRSFGQPRLQDNDFISNARLQQILDDEKL